METQSNYLIAFDPGKVTGFAVFDRAWGCVLYGQVPAEQLEAVTRNLHAAFPGARVVADRLYLVTLGTHTRQLKQLEFSISTVFPHIIWLDSGVWKPFTQDDVRLFYFMPVHARDAFRLGIYYLAKKQNR